jgi:predicted nucleic acid-binding protein
LRRSKPAYVLDATAIIHFAKIDKLTLILSTFEVYITREVYREVVDRGEGRPDALVVREAVDRGQIKVYEVRDPKLIRAFQRHPEIHAGEAETLAAAKELNVPAVIDEAEARAVAETYGVTTKTGTLFLLFRLLTLGRIDPDECAVVLDELVESGLYIDPLTLIRAKRRILEKSSTF